MCFEGNAYFMDKSLKRKVAYFMEKSLNENGCSFDILDKKEFFARIRRRSRRRRRRRETTLRKLAN